jgi:hypothetical protein
VLDVTARSDQAFQQTVKQHLNQLNIVSCGCATADFDFAVALNGSQVGTHLIHSCVFICLTQAVSVASPQT